MSTDVDMTKTDFELFLPLLRSTTAAEFAEVLRLLKDMYTAYMEKSEKYVYWLCSVRVMHQLRPTSCPVSSICFAASTSSFLASGMPWLGLYWPWAGLWDFEPSGLGLSGDLEIFLLVCRT